MQIAFNCVFSGWRVVTKSYDKDLFDTKKKRKEQSFVIDVNARMVNESGSSVLLNEVMPLINPVSATSHMKPIEIYNLWHGHIASIKMVLRDSYFYPSFICSNNKCRFITPNEKLADEHMAIYKHPKYNEVINPFELDIARAPNIITLLCTLSIITAKSKEGFTLRELAESFMTQQTIQSGQMVQQQPVGILRRLTGRGNPNQGRSYG